MSKNLTAFIFARGGSKGVPRKNVSLAGGKPLIAHSIAAGLASKYVSRIVVSTDNDEIAQVAKQHGAEILERPAELATDSAPEIQSWRHAIDSYPQLFVQEKQPFISLPATAPLRKAEDVDAGVERFRQGGCDIVFSVTPARSSPWLGMVVDNGDGLIAPVIPGGAAQRRQDVPKVFEITPCVYVVSADHVKNCTRLVDGRAGYIIVPGERALDVDTPYDLYLADLLLTHPFKGKA